jgi:hypothetical protein
MSWDRRFADPIKLPGKNLITLRDAALYITKLPKAEHEAEEWQAAMQVLMLVAERGGPAMFARIGRRAGAERRQAEAGDHATPQARQAPEDRQMKVLIYVDTSKEVGDVDHLKVFADDEAAEAWFKENDPEGVAFEYELGKASRRATCHLGLTINPPRFRARAIDSTGARKES